MSTVHEATAAAQLKMKTAGLSPYYEYGGGNHRPRAESRGGAGDGRQGAERFAALLEAMIRAL